MSDELDDLVARLNLGDQMNGRTVDCKHDLCNCQTMNEAADAIAQLRADLAAAQAQVAELAANQVRLEAESTERLRAVVKAEAERDAALAEAFADLHDDDLLRELVRRNPPEDPPRGRTPHDKECLVGIGKDHHCYIIFGAEDLAALASEART